MLSKIKNRLGELQFIREWRTRRLLHWSMTEPAAILLSRPGRYAHAPVETTFRGKSGASIPVLRGYRYDMAPVMTHLAPFRLLAVLDREQRLTPAERSAFHKAKGERTLGMPYGDVLALVSGLIGRVADRLVPEGRDNPELAELMPSEETLAARMAEEISILRSRLIRIRQFAAPVADGCRVLEIGFMTGGYSIDAWDQLGFQITGIDNAYDGTATPPTIYRHIAERLGTKPNFVFGDVTKRTSLPDGSFDVVYSVSVLEHISDVAAAFQEFRRLLKPGGLMIHSWNPYFSPNGGHPWGLLDCPWGHVRVPFSDLDQYLAELRPHEAPVSGPWVHNTLDRKTTLAKMQSTVSDAGFRVLLWDQISYDPATLGDLTPEVFAQCRAAYPDVTLADLTTRDGMMVVRKE